VSLDELKEKVSAAFLARGKAMHTSAIVFRIVFLAVPALATGVAQFITWKESPAPAQIVGICGACVLFFATIFLIFREKDAGEQLVFAHNSIAKGEELIRGAVDAANRERERFLAILDELPDIDRNIALYQTTKLLRNALEQALLR
jgi:hypothetical protein